MNGHVVYGQALYEAGRHDEAMATFETALSLALRELVSSKLMSLPTLIERMSCAPAKLWHLPGGTLRRGSAADLVAFDPSASWTVDPARFHSKSRNTPWAGEVLPGVVRYTLVGGRTVIGAAVR